MTGEKILVIDDDDVLLALLDEQFLSPFGFKVYKAASRAVGLEMAVKHLPDLILLDMKMLSRIGPDLLADMRRAECFAPAILMTARESENISLEALRLGVRDYIARPFTSDEIRLVIDRVLRESCQVRENADLHRDLNTAEGVRITIVTLSHYLNNYLTALNGGLNLLKESLDRKLPDPELLEIISTGRKSARSIQAVLRILLNTTTIRLSNYTSTTPMINIDSVIQEELRRMPD